MQNISRPAYLTVTQIVMSITESFYCNMSEAILGTLIRFPLRGVKVRPFLKTHGSWCILTEQKNTDPLIRNSQFLSGMLQNTYDSVPIFILLQSGTWLLKYVLAATSIISSFCHFYVNDVRVLKKSQQQYIWLSQFLSGTMQNVCVETCQKRFWMRYLVFPLWRVQN